MYYVKELNIPNSDTVSGYSGCCGSGAGVWGGSWYGSDRGVDNCRCTGVGDRGNSSKGLECFLGDPSKDISDELDSVNRNTFFSVESGGRLSFLGEFSNEISLDELEDTPETEDDDRTFLTSFLPSKNGRVIKSKIVEWIIYLEYSNRRTSSFSPRLWFNWCRSIRSEWILLKKQ